MNPNLDPFLADAFDDPREGEALLAALVASLEPVTPSPALRQRVLAATDGPGRLYRFAEKIAAMVDVSLEKARAMLDRVADLTQWERDLFPGMDALWVEGGAAAAGCIRGFARLRAGASFPDHTHLGTERQLVLEGTLLDSNGVVARPGDLVCAEAGTSHSYRAAPGGPDLLFFVVAAEGIELPGGVLRHRDPVEG